MSSRSEPSTGKSGLWCLCALSAGPDGEAASLLRFLRRRIKALLLRCFCGRTSVESLRRKVGPDYKPSLLNIQFKKIQLGTNGFEAMEGWSLI